MDNRLRYNERCVVGLPSCGNAFSSVRSCFIAYSFNESNLEKDILISVLKDRGIEPIEASPPMSSGSYVFCTKICSKIISSQFCAVLLNGSMRGEEFIPNPNVYMEYGLMLGFNKYIIPFQNENQSLPFNVAGLETIKYDGKSFQTKSIDAVDSAIKCTDKNVSSGVVDINNIIGSFLIHKGVILSALRDPGDQNIFDLGSQLGYMFGYDFSGSIPHYIGNFTNLRSEIIIWKILNLYNILRDRINAIPTKMLLNDLSSEKAQIIYELFNKTKVIIIVSGSVAKEEIESKIAGIAKYSTVIYSIDEVYEEVQAIV